MEQISNLMAQQDLTPERTNFLTDLKTKLEPEERRIIELKYSGKTFGVMEENERWFAAKTLLLKIHSITGWSIPVSEMMDILVDQFQKKLQEGYSKVTVAEIEYAFRNKGTDIKDWGKAMNLSLFDEVMLPYLENRFELSRFEESLKTKSAIQIEEKKELTNEDWEEWLVDIKSYRLELIPVSAYDYLLRSEKIKLTTAEKKEYMDRATTIYGISIQDDLKLWDEFIKQKEEKKISGKHNDSLVVISKRLIVHDYLNPKQEDGAGQ